MESEHKNSSNHWKKEEEEILKKWGDKALFYKIMHDKAYKKTWCLSAWFNIPIIVLSTISGSINFLSGNFEQYKNIIIILSGIMNILTGLLGTISTYIGLSKKVEGHRIAFLSWDKFSRKIQIELSKPRYERINIKDFIKICTDDYDRLVEISPIIGDDIIRWMKKFIENGELEEANINSCCICLYDFCLFPCNCGGILYCLKNQKNNDENKNVFSGIEKPEILGYIQPIQIAMETKIEVEIHPESAIENEYAPYTFSRNSDN
jgi:hypothetical protein